MKEMSKVSESSKTCDEGQINLHHLHYHQRQQLLQA